MEDVERLKCLLAYLDCLTNYVYDNDHDYYECSSCGLVWALGNEFSLKENQMYYCPKCGRRIVEAEGGGSDG